ncbi:hypothetical protein [Desulfobotulus mexicanus]|uniref:Uncharacterized protein n=1 Tax=Desulfobotulus mexicanus TaxID=2586642 RepID=A0A5Q4VFU7_9BACT|nr:hypothetical protein [Desulfobotulus mexicanus]TYT75142.1 hypothetical protein FIM25_05345 [Desulfobotulus mexicanus]
MKGKTYEMQRLFVALDFSGEERLRVYEAAERIRVKGAFLPPMPDLGKIFTMNLLGVNLYRSELRPEGPVYSLLVRSDFMETGGF